MNSPWSPASHRRKLARAKRHIEDVEALLAAWSSDGYRVCEQSKGNRRFVLYAEQLKPLPDELPLVVGDAFQCLRNSLDHIVFALARKETPSMTAEQEQKVAFPVTKNGTAVGGGHPRIQLVKEAVRNDIRDLAPDSARQPLDQDPVWLLDKMSNRDKHREVSAIPVARSGTELSITASSGGDYFYIFGPQRLEANAGGMPLVEFDRSPDVEAEIRYSLQILFDQGVEVEDREMTHTLWWMHDHIRDTVFQRLEAHL